MENEIKEKAPLEEDKKYLADMRIKYLKQKLKETDYIANKLTEAVAEYLITNDIGPLKELKTKYAEQLTQRQIWRDEINELESST